MLSQQKYPKLGVLIDSYAGRNTTLWNYLVTFTAALLTLDNPKANKERFTKSCHRVRTKRQREASKNE